MSREMELWVRDAQVQQQRYDDERRKNDVELEPLMIKLQVVFRMIHALAGASMPNAISSCSQIAREVTAEHRLQVASARAACVRNEETLLQLLRKISTNINKDWSRSPAFHGPLVHNAGAGANIYREHSVSRSIAVQQHV
jgi:hypothetical protein